MVTNDSPKPCRKVRFVYRVPAGTGALHVVLDAPTGTTGRSDVIGVSDGVELQDHRRRPHGISRRIRRSTTRRADDEHLQHRRRSYR